MCLQVWDALSERVEGCALALELATTGGGGGGAGELDAERERAFSDFISVVELVRFAVRFLR